MLHVFILGTVRKKGPPHLQHSARWRVKPEEGSWGKALQNCFTNCSWRQDLRLKPKFPRPIPVVFSRVPLLSPSTSSQAASHHQDLRSSSYAKSLLDSPRIRALDPKTTRTPGIGKEVSGQRGPTWRNLLVSISRETCKHGDGVTVGPCSRFYT